MTFDRHGRREALNEAKRNIVKALNDAGEISFFHETVKDLRIKATRHFGAPLAGEHSVEYFYRVSGIRPRTKFKGSGQIATPSEFKLIQRPEFRPQRHLRDDELSVMPTPISMPWDGHGNWTEGARW